VENPARILIVDDESEVCDFLSEFLRSQGFETACADTRENAMEAIEKMSLDAILLDVRLRGGKEPYDGIEILEYVKRKYPAVFVMMITGIDDPDLAKQSARLGADDFITKPLSLDILEADMLKKIRNHISQKTTRH